MVLHLVINYVYRDTLLLFLTVNLTFGASFICYRADQKYYNYILRLYQDVKRGLAEM